MSRQQNKILLLIPDLRGSGGVANYYNALDMGGDPDKDYFVVNEYGSKSWLQVLRGLLYRYIRFTWVLALERPNLVHVNPSFNRKSFLRDGIFVGIALLFNRNVLVLFHGWDDTFMQKVLSSRLLKAYFDMTFGRVRNVIVLGRVFKDRLQALGLVRARYWIETTIASQQPGRAFDLDKKIDTWEKTSTIVFMSRMVREKGIYVALDTYYALLDGHPNHNIRLIIAGDGEELNKAKAYAKSKGRGDVTFTGYVRGDQKQRLLSEGHVLLLPTSYGEGMPLVVLEAMVYGMPIISRSVAGIPDIVRSGVNGLLTDSKDPLVFAELLGNLIENRGLYAEMARENHRYGCATFGSDIVRKRLLSIYEQVGI